MSTSFTSPTKTAKEEKDASIELRDFVYEVEASAKKILQRSAKKRMEETMAKKNRERKEMYGGTGTSSRQSPSTSVGHKKLSSSAYASAASPKHTQSLRETVVLQIPAGMKGSLEQVRETRTHLPDGCGTPSTTLLPPTL